MYFYCDIIFTGAEFGGILRGVASAFLLKGFLFVSVRHLRIQIHFKISLCSFFNQATSVNLDLEAACWSACGHKFSKDLFIPPSPRAMAETEIFLSLPLCSGIFLGHSCLGFIDRCGQDFTRGLCSHSPPRTRLDPLSTLPVVGNREALGIRVWQMQGRVKEFGIYPKARGKSLNM